ncbi:hypothetical protein D3C81_1921790 [compost metagenome]
MELKEGKQPNRLINEKSPYLLQHAHNPVDWSLVKARVSTARWDLKEAGGKSPV